MPKRDKNKGPAEASVPSSSSVKDRKDRREVEPLEITALTSLDHMTLVTRHGLIVQASSTGLLIRIPHAELVPKMLRENLTLNTIKGDRVFFTIGPLDLEMAGTITRTRLIGGKTHELAIDFSEDAPEYWRECLIDLLPRVGHLAEEYDA